MGVFQPVVVQSSEAVVRQEALVTEQANLLRQKIATETDMMSRKARLPSATGVQREQLTEAILSGERELAGFEAALAETRAKIGQVQGGQAVVFEPGMEVPPPHDERMFGLTPGEFMGAVGILMLLPLVLAATQAMWRRSSAPSALRTDDTSERLARLERAVESVAIEVERIGESQRFNTRLLTERPPEAGSVRVGESAHPAGDARR